MQSLHLRVLWVIYSELSALLSHFCLLDLLKFPLFVEQMSTNPGLPFGGGSASVGRTALKGGGRGRLAAGAAPSRGRAGRRSGRDGQMQRDHRRRGELVASPLSGEGGFSTVNV